MVLTEAVRMAEGNSSPINNILANNSVMTAAGITNVNENTNNKPTSPTRLAQPILPTAERPMLGGSGYDGSTSSSSRNKQPIYTRDKRTKFTQRENKKWVRLATVLGYLVAVCIPAIALSIYYIGFWDPRYEEQYKAHLKEKMTHKEDRQQQQQCCTACNCAGTSSPSPLSGHRDPRHLGPIDDEQAKLAASRLVYDGVGERAAENAYYHNILLGKNYVIYGAASEDGSVETAPDLSSPSGSEPTTPNTHPSPASDRMTSSGIRIGPPHEKRNHGNLGSGQSNDAILSHSQHRQHKAQAPH